MCCLLLCARIQICVRHKIISCFYLRNEEILASDWLHWDNITYIIFKSNLFRLWRHQLLINRITRFLIFGRLRVPSRAACDLSQPVCHGRGYVTSSMTLVVVLLLMSFLRTSPKLIIQERCSSSLFIMKER